MGQMNQPKKPGTILAGWLVKAEQGYYTGKQGRAFARWTPFPKFAKVYQRQRWAQSMATRLGGQAVPRTVPDGSTTKLP